MIVIGADTHKSSHTLVAQEGKSNREAIRCLKRHLARRIWRLLQPAQTEDNPAMTIYCNRPHYSFALT